MSDVWVDASAGASGDMLLGALVGAGVPLAVLQSAVDAVSPEPVGLRVEAVTRAGLAATRVHVEVADSIAHRTWVEVRALLEGAPLEPAVRERARTVFAALAEAEAHVHGTAVDDVAFHEVGALDSLADVVGCSAGLAHLLGDEGRLTVSPIAVGSGRIASAHGSLPVPVPAVTRLLRGVATSAGPGEGELCTPTGAALLANLADDVGPQPAMAVSDIGTGAGALDPGTHANVVRLLVAGTLDAETTATELVLETNVDDLDPRVWPHVLEALLGAGAADAWLTPIVMKKGRPAHTLGVLTRPEHVEAVRAVIWRETSSIGVREHAVTKRALPREEVTVEVAGHPVRVKVSRAGGRVVTAQPEHDDCAAVASATGWPIRHVIDAARVSSRPRVEP
ncbi:nickel pincer cofactor biosynthesis protein LarC [Nocardioides acrostichi]|uniref:Pyridinium-3,5-bisthiocarboxylic acid mononucleotide nickel insertion protein n=1 Tax=Nocardioides acrostichi TaxID=2784339 RepID=A0A930V497_9ACTN|nr:nickel pincer cofactor biosynthesis protein LarC [Nocardioides acrostichi]MBF4163724.1 nickel pincer cofactor biosynthesis protein LarC [Nocardioides acrostichi]